MAATALGKLTGLVFKKTGKAGKPVKQVGAQRFFCLFSFTSVAHNARLTVTDKI